MVLLPICKTDKSLQMKSLLPGFTKFCVKFNNIVMLVQTSKYSFSIMTMTKVIVIIIMLMIIIIIVMMIIVII